MKTQQTAALEAKRQRVAELVVAQKLAAKREEAKKKAAELEMKKQQALELAEEKQRVAAVVVAKKRAKELDDMKIQCIFPPVIQKNTEELQKIQKDRDGVINEVNNQPKPKLVDAGKKLIAIRKDEKRAAAERKRVVFENNVLVTEKKEAARVIRENLIADGQRRVDGQRAAEKIRMLTAELKAAEKKRDKALRAHIIAVAQAEAGAAQNPGDTDPEKGERKRLANAESKAERVWKYAGFVAEMAKKRLERIQTSREN
ncbi:MAG: uncharacterized protein A8A55_3086, partial [Amphiamblys sp. WSBS2006]